MRDAFIITEDKRFYEHRGIDWVRVFGAAAHNIASRGFGQGFSTLTMQLARNIFPEKISREKTLIRKLRETKVAFEIEAIYPKDKILELYLNQIYLGNGAYGVETAAQRYFGKSVRDVNLAEAAMLAALPKAPERYNPRRYPDRAIQRRNTIIALMRNEGVVSELDARLAQAYPLDLARRSRRRRARALLRGVGAPAARGAVRREALLRRPQDLHHARHRHRSRPPSAISNASCAAIEAGTVRPLTRTPPTSSTSRAPPPTARAPSRRRISRARSSRWTRATAPCARMVGGRDFDDSKFNRATQALRQPGSTFKPIVYADAIHHGLSASHLLDDSPLILPQFGGTDWMPQNYDLKFMGVIPLRQALYLSRNLATIRLGLELGPQSVIEMARKLGLTTPIPPYPSIFIGSADVYPIEMIAAYSAFATLGVRTAPHGIVRVENAKGQVLWEGSAPPLRGAVARRGVADGGHDEGRAEQGLRRRRPRVAASRSPPPARPAPRTTTPTSGSSATPPISSPASGWASTGRRRSRPTRRAAASPRRRGRAS